MKTPDGESRERGVTSCEETSLVKPWERQFERGSFSLFVGNRVVDGGKLEVKGFDWRLFVKTVLPTCAEESKVPSYHGTLVEVQEEFG